MRVISVQDSFQDRTLKEDNFNLLVQKNRELKDQRGSWLVYEYGLKSFLQKKLKILFLLERSELWCLSSTNSLMFNSFKFNKFITHTKKCNSAWADFFFFFVQFGSSSSHDIYDSPCHPSVYHYVMLAPWTAWSRPISHMKRSNHLSIATIR